MYVVQVPLTSLYADVAATRLVLDRAGIPYTFMAGAGLLFLAAAVAGRGARIGRQSRTTSKETN